MIAIARTVPKTNASLAGSGFGAIVPSWRQIDVARPDFRGANWKRCMSHVTLRRLSKKIRRCGRAATTDDYAAGAGCSTSPGPAWAISGSVHGRGWAQAYRGAAGGRQRTPSDSPTLAIGEPVAQRQHFS